MKVNSFRPRLRLSLLVVIFVALGCYYSVITPMFESPDEVWHYNFVREVAVHRGLPVVNTGVKQTFAHEGLQSPLYYVIGAAFIGWMDPRDLADLPAPNPYVRIGVPAYGTNDNRNAFVHSSVDGFPYHGAALAVHLLRLYSVLLGAATVIFTYLLAHEILLPSAIKRGANEEAIALRVAFLSAAFVAFLPQFLFISGAVNNDNMATMFSAASVWQLARVMNRGFDRKSSLFLGLLVGGALLAKISALPLVPFVLLVIAIIAWRDHKWQAAIVFGSVFLIVIALLVGWWFLRNVQLYGQLIPFSTLAVLVGARPSQLSLWRWLSAEGEGLRLSAWGVFGWFNVSGSSLFYFFYDALAVIGLVGFSIALINRRVLPIKLAILTIWVAVCAGALWSYSSTIVSTQGRLLFPAISAWAVLWAWGILCLSPERYQPWLAGAASGALFISALITPASFISPAYSPTLVAENAVPAALAETGRRFDNGVEWVGVSLDRLNVRAGDSTEVTIYERLLTSAAPRAAIFIHLVNSAGVIVAQRDSLIASGNAIPSRFPIVIADALRVEIPSTVPAPDDWRVEMGLYDPESGKRFAAFDKSGQAVGDSYVVATLRGEAAGADTFRFDFDGHVSLVGASLDRNAVAPGDVLHLMLNWGGTPPERNRFHVFVHALGEGDHIWAAADDAIGDAQTNRLELRFDPVTPPGVYPLELGVYPPPDGDRLGVFDSNGQDLGDRIFLGPIRVGP